MSVYAASIDDNDPQVLYGNGWVLVTQDGDWTGTMHSTSDIGSVARVRFTGSRVAVVCTIPTGDGQLSKASFALDNGSPVQMSHATTPPVQWQTVFWDSGPLAFGSHLLVITNTGNDAYFRLDHIDYDPTSASSPSSSGGSGSGKTTTVKSTLTSTVVVGNPNSPSSSGSSGSAAISKTSESGTAVTSQTGSVSVVHGSGASFTPSSSTGASSASTVGSTIGDAASAAAATSSSNKSSTPIAGIVAGILGALLGIVLLVLVLLYLRRRRRRSNGVHLNDGDMSHRSENTVIPTPFSLNGAPSEMSSSNHRSSPSVSSPYGSSSFDTSSSPINSTSMYTSGSEPATMMGGHYGQLQFQHLGAVAGTAAGRSKRAEFMAEQQQQSPLVESPVVATRGDYGGGSVSGAFRDQDAPPAYPGSG